MSIEEQIRTIAKEELSTEFEEIEKSLKAAYRKDNRQIREDLKVLTGKIEKFTVQMDDLLQRIEKLEEEMNNRWSLVVKLRKYTLDQLMSEYKRLTGQMRPEQEESIENAET
jgi:peptidoglycan hydrolase CwlO-like protein